MQNNAINTLQLNGVQWKQNALATSQTSRDDVTPNLR